MTKKKELLFVLGSYGQFNIGDEALLQVMRDQLGEKYDLVFNSHQPEVTAREFGVETVFTYPQKDLIKKLRILWKCRAVVYGGGTMITQKVKILLAMLLGNLAARLLGKKVVYLGIGVGDLRGSKVFQILARWVCRTAHLVTLRDEESLVQLKNAGVDLRKVKVTADPVLLLEPCSKDEVRVILTEEGLDLQRPIFGVSVRYISDVVAYQHMTREVAQVCERLISDRGVQVLFIPIQWSFTYSERYRWKYDDQACREVYELLDSQNQVYQLSRRYLPSQIMGIIGLLDSYLSVPLHSLMMAAKQGVPVAALNYSAEYNQKIPQFMGGIGREEFLVPSYFEVRSDELKRLLDLCLDSGSRPRRQLVEETARLVKSAQENFRRLSEVLGKRGF